MRRTRRREWAELPPSLVAEVEERAGGAVRGFEEAPGRVPHEPWRPAELAAALDMLTTCAETLTPAPLGGLPTVAARMAGRCELWTDPARPASWTGRACVGPAWTDLVCLILESGLGDPDPEEVFRAHPAGSKAPPEQVDALLVALLGYWTRSAAIPGPAHAPHLRERRDHSRPATLGWLRTRWA